MYGIINWIICVFTIFCVLINAVCTFAYSFKSDNGKLLVRVNSYS